MQDGIILKVIIKSDTDQQIWAKPKLPFNFNNESCCEARVWLINAKINHSTESDLHTDIFG